MSDETHATHDHMLRQRATFNSSIDNSEYERLERENAALKAENARLERDFSACCAEASYCSVEHVMELEAERDALRDEKAGYQRTFADIIAFTEWAKDTDLSGDDWLTELRHPEQVTAKMVWDIATRKPLSEAGTKWAQKRLRELGLLENDKREDG